MPEIIPGEPLVTLAEVAERLGKSYAVVYQAAYKGSVPSVKVPRVGLRGSSIMIPESYLATWVIRSRAPRRSEEVTAQLEVCFARARRLNHVGVRA